MSVVLISAELRQGLEEALAAQFNVELAAACDALLIPVFAFNWARDARAARPKSCYEGNRTLGQVMEFEEPDFPAVTWWTGGAQDLNTYKPRRFSGVVGAGWRFWLTVKGRNNSGLREMREAVEAALAAVVCGLNVDHGRYRKDLTCSEPVEMQWLDQSTEKHVGWLQELTFNASFEVHV